MNLIEIGQKFVDFRDRGDFDGAAQLVHPQCVYIFKNRAVIGREKIVETFKRGQSRVALDPIENAVRVRSGDRDELLVIENGVIVKIENLNTRL